MRATRFLQLQIAVGLVVAGPAAVWASEQKSTVSPAAALKLLQDGNKRFSTGHAEHPHVDAARIADVAVHGQHPVATIVACSDSRVPVELLFDEGVGDLFVIRVAGNVCDVDEVGSIEYSVAHLGTPLVVIMGHSHCGAVSAVAGEADLEGSIPRLVDNIRPAVDAVKKTKPGLSGEELIEASVQANVWQAIEDLLKSSPIARSRCRNGELKIVGAMYSLETGTVTWLGAHPQQDRLLKTEGRPAGAHSRRPAKARSVLATADSSDLPASKSAPVPSPSRAGPAGGGNGYLRLGAFAALLLLIRAAFGLLRTSSLP